MEVKGSKYIHDGTEYEYKGKDVTKGGTYHRLLNLKSGIISSFSEESYKKSFKKV